MCWNGVTTGVSQLQTNAKIIGVAERARMGFDKVLPKCRDAGKVAFAQHQLSWIGASIVTNGHCFSPPDQFGSAEAKSLPASTGEIRGFALLCSVPALHRQNAKSVSDFPGSTESQAGQWRVRCGGNGSVVRNRQTKLVDPILKLLRRLK